MEYKVNIQESLEAAFLEYGASVAQERSIADIRDGLKIGLRQGLYSQFYNKLTSKYKFQKAQKSVAAAMSLCYVHGDSSMYKNFIRAAKPWSFRYPLEETQGSCGTQCGPDTESAARYVEMRSNELADYFFAGIKKNAVDEWYDNYDDTEKIPAVLPSIGFWNIINGCTGIAVGMATSCPQFNLKEVNAAIIRLIKNPNASFNELYCVPDFCCGGYILNPAETRASIEAGQGKSIRLRAKIEYNSKENCLIATELPYGVFVDTIIGQIAKAVEENEDYGIDRVIDHTKQFADIRIYLSKNANPAIVEKRLYKDTSLESFFAVHMLMLDHGRFPRIFGWKDALQAYIDHIRECKRRELEYDFNKLKARNHILDGLLTAIADIDETIHIIKSSASSAAAKAALMRHYDIDEDQAKAILDIKLARLAHLEALELESERKQNQLEIDRLSDILSHQDKLDEILISILQEVADKFGDERRTKILTITEEPEEEIEEKEINVNIAGDKLRINPKKVAGQNISTTNLGTLVCVSSAGLLYKISMRDVEEGKTYSVSQLTKAADAIVGIYDLSNINLNKYWVFITKNGLIKKSPVKEYNYVGRQGTKMLKLKDDDAVIAAYLLSGDKDMISVHTSDKFYAHYSGQEIPESGKAAMGVKAINLGANQTIIKAQLNPTGLKITGRAVKGVKE